MLKTVVLRNHFLLVFFYYAYSSKEQHLFETENFNLKKVFSATFDQFNAALLNKSSHFLTQNYLTRWAQKFEQWCM